MNWFAQSLRNKILALATLAALMVGLAAGYGFNTSLSDLDKLEQITRGDLANTQEVEGMVVNFKKQVQEWKNTLIRGHDPAQMEKYWGAFTTLEQKLQASAEKLLKNMAENQSEENIAAREQIQQFLDAHKVMAESYRKGLEVFKQSNFDIHAADAAVKGVDRKPTDTLEKAAEILSNHATASMQASIEHTRASIHTSLVLMAIAIVVAAVGFIVLLGRLIIAPSQRLVADMALLAEGNFSSKIEPSSEDELGQLARSAQHIQRQMAQLFGELHGLSNSLVDTAQGMSTQAERTSAAVSQQSSQTQQIAHAAQEMATALSRIDQHAGSVQNASESAMHETESGRAIVNRSVDAINKLAQEISDSSVVIQRLEQNGARSARCSM